MKTKMLRTLAIFLIIEIGLIHYLSSQHEFEEAWILGYLFIANFLGALVAAYGIYRRKTWGWALGALISIGSIAAYIWSRTSGLPGLRREEWLFPWGVASLVTEVLFCLVVALQAWRVKRTGDEPVPANSNWRRLVPAVGLIALVLINTTVYRWDALYPELDHVHVFFLWQVRLQPEVSQNTLADEYGLQVSRVAVSAMGGIVDLRMRVLDPEKADQVLEDGHFALLVGDTLIPSPHVSRHVLANKIIVVMFPNLKQIVGSGSQVSVVFENMRVVPVTVQ